MTAGQHWLYTWIDEYDITSPSRAMQLLGSGPAMQRLHELATAVPDPKSNGVHDADIIAGYTLDLNSRITCSQAGCVARRVDRLFSRAWHYFDRVVVQGPSGSDWASRIEKTPSKRRARMAWDLKEDVAVLLHLRKVGAERHMVFAEKPYRSCRDEHFHEHAADLGLGVVNEPAQSDVVNAILAEAEIAMDRDGSGWIYWYKHPNLEETIVGYCGGKKRPSGHQIARLVYHRVGINLVSDISLARELRLPLALTSGIPAAPTQSAEKLAGDRDEDLVALELALPVVSGVTAQDLLRFREDNWPQFERFRAALRQAIREQTARIGGGAPGDIARAVQREFIEPEIANIERQLQLASKSLALKSGAAVSVGLAVTAVGLVVAAPLVIAAGVAASGLVGPSILKYVEDRTAIETSDLYFLWKATVQNG